MPWPFDREYMQLALAASAVIGICAPLMGAFLVQRRMSLFSDGIGHAAFAGVAAGLLTGIHPMIAALIVAALAATGVELLRIGGRLSGDLSLAVFLHSGIALGVVLSSLAGSYNGQLLSFLFGSVLTVQPFEVAIIAIVGVVVVGFVATFRHKLFAIATDEEWARVAGVRTTALSVSSSILTAAVVVVAMRVTGLLLVAAMMVLPVAAAKVSSKSFYRSCVVGSGFGLAAVVIGLTLSRGVGLAPGGTIVLTSSALFVVVSVIHKFRTGLAS